MRQATEHYKKLINKPIWLGGISSGGVRVIATISGKDRFSDNYAGLIFSSTYVSRIWQSGYCLNILILKVILNMK